MVAEAWRHLHSRGAARRLLRAHKSDLGNTIDWPRESPGSDRTSGWHRVGLPGVLPSLQRPVEVDGVRGNRRRSDHSVRRISTRQIKTRY